jgi:hypothetical protein
LSEWKTSKKLLPSQLCLKFFVFGNIKSYFPE